MPIDLKAYKVFIASPGGLDDERKAFSKVLNNHSEIDARYRGCTFEPVGWERTLRGMGRPQTHISNDLTVCDFFVMVLHDRWGTPPGPDEDGRDASSGTKEEYDLARRLFDDPTSQMKDILLFFRAVEPRQMSDPGPQLKQVLEFRDSIERERRLFFYTYDSLPAFEDKLRGELARWVRDHEGGKGKKKTRPRKPKGDAPVGKKEKKARRTSKGRKTTILDRAEKLADEGRLTEAERLFAKAVVDFENTDALNRYGLYLHRLGRETHEQAMFERVLEIALSSKDNTGAAIAYGNLGLIYKTRGELGKAEEMLRKSLEINEQLGRHEGIANDYGNLGLVYETRGQLDKAEAMHRKSLAINERLGRQKGMAINYGNLGNIYKTRGELNKAEEMHRKSLAIEERLGRQEGMAADYGNLGLIYKTRGELDKAEEMLRKSLEIHERLGRQEGMAANYANLGVIEELQGDTAKAQEHWQKALAIYAKVRMPHMVTKVQGWLDGLAKKEKK